jgi:hypothetical protein
MNYYDYFTRERKVKIQHIDIKKKEMSRFLRYGKSRIILMFNEKEKKILPNEHISNWTKKRYLLITKWFDETIGIEIEDLKFSVLIFDKTNFTLYLVNFDWEIKTKIERLFIKKALTEDKTDVSTLLFSKTGCVLIWYTNYKAMVWL